MALNINSEVIISSNWTVFKSNTITTYKTLSIQFDDDGTIYTIFAFDYQTAYTCVIWKGTVPDSVISSGYSQAQNDSDKADFENNFKSIANKRATDNINQIPVFNNDTVITSGSKIYNGIVNRKINLFINIINAPTGTGPGIQFTIQEIDPGDLTTSVGNSITGSIINSSGIQEISLDLITSSAIKISWVITGTSSPTFTGVYTTIVSKTSEIITANIGTTNGLALDATLTGGMAKTQIYDGSNVIGTLSHPVRIDPTGTTTQPISGTITANAGSGTFVVSGIVTSNVGTTGGLALDSSVNGILLSQGSTTSGEKGPLIQGAVTTSAPSYTNAQTSPFSLTTSGALRVDGSATTQPISGTVTSNQGSAASLSSGWPVKITDGVNTAGISTVGSDKALKVDVIQSVGGSGGTSSSFGTSFPVSGTASGFNDGINMQGARVFDADTGAGTEYIIGINLRGSSSGGSLELATNSNPLRIDPTGTTIQPISGTVTANAGSGTFTISGTVTANIGTTGGLALDTSINGILLSQGSTTSGEKGPLIQGAVTTSAPSYTTAQTSPLSLTTSGLLRVDGSGATQPISGTVTANAGSGTFTVSGTVTSNIGTTGGLALDSTLTKLTITQGTALGSNTQALVGGSVTTSAPSYSTGNINPLSLTTTGLLRVDGSGVTQPISGTITVNQGTNPWTDDITDRAVRLLGVIYGSQGQQLKQTATNFNTQVEIAVGGTLIDPRQIRALISSDVVTANIGTTGGLALDTSVNGLLLSQGSTTSGEKGSLIQGAVTTSAPSYTTGQTNPLSLTTSGALRVDGSTTTQPISGTVTANQGTANTLSNAWPVKVTDGTNTLPTGDVPGRAIFEKITDGTNTANVAAASTPPIATDPALIVNLSPNRPATYAASTNGAISISTNATATTSVAYIFHTSSNTKRIEIYRIEVSAGLETGANHDFTLRGNFITAENGTPGGTSQIANPLDRGDSASTITSTTGVFRTGATGAPTRVTGDLISEEMYINSSGSSQKILFDIHITGKPIVLRASTSEGFEIRAVGGGNGNLAQGCEVTVTMYWIEV